MMSDQGDIMRKSKPILHDPNIIPRVKQVSGNVKFSINCNCIMVCVRLCYRYEF